jgi:hypothetical protein
MEWVLVIFLLHSGTDFAKKPQAPSPEVVQKSYGYQAAVIPGFASLELCQAAGKSLASQMLPNSVDSTKPSIPVATGHGECIQTKPPLPK